MYSIKATVALFILLLSVSGCCGTSRNVVGLWVNYHMDYTEFMPDGRYIEYKMIDGDKEILVTGRYHIDGNKIFITRERAKNQNIEGRTVELDFIISDGVLSFGVMGIEVDNLKRVN